jgi:ribosomal protein S18 acetylase RimI-like enzyme
MSINTEKLQVAVRQAALSDIAAILNLYEAAGITGEKRLSTAEGLRKLEEISRYPFYRVFVATDGDVIVGSYEFLLMDNLAKGGAKTAIVEDVAVDPRVQRKGIGRKMMNHAMALAKEKGAYKLVLSSNKNRTEAHAFYESLGFERHGISFRV